MTFNELLDLAKDDPVLKEELKRAKTEDLDTFCARIANVIVGTDLPPSRLVEELQERASARLTDELLMPEKLLKRLIKEQMAPQYVKIRHTNPKTGVEETDIVESKLDYHSILVNVADLLQVSYNDLERRLKNLEFINR